MIKHEWICDKCGRDIPFRIPERPQDDFNSEMNEDKQCICGEAMYFDEVPAPKTAITPEGDPP